MAIAIVKLKKDGEVVYPRTSTSAVNSDPNLWNLNWDNDKERDSLGNTRLPLTAVLKRIPDIIQDTVTNHVLKKSNIINNEGLIIDNNFNNDSQAPSALAVKSVVEKTLGWTIKEIDSI